MIDFRYHLVSLVSVFLALAVGVVLGAGPLRGQIAENLNDQVRQLQDQKEQLRAERDSAQAGQRNRDAFVTQLMPGLVAQQLGGRSVVVVSLPEADGDVVAPLVEALQAAGARVTGRVQVREAWTAPSKAPVRERLAERWRPLLTGATAPARGAEDGSPSPLAASAATASPTATGPASSRPTSPASPRPTSPPATQRRTSPTAGDTGAVGNVGAVGATLEAVLTRALVTTDLAAAERPDETGRQVLDSLAKDDLISVDGELTGRATEAVVIAPGVEQATVQGQLATASPSATVDLSGVWTSLATALDRGGDGVVVVGPASSASSGGVVAAVRSGAEVAKMVSTVDTGGTPMGDVATVLALREQLSGGAGAYGFGRAASAPLPASAGAP